MPDESQSAKILFKIPNIDHRSSFNIACLGQVLQGLVVGTVDIEMWLVISIVEDGDDVFYSSAGTLLL